MVVCNYCSRDLKKEYNICPGSGSSKFERINDFGKVIIKTTPEGAERLHFLLNLQGVNKSSKTLPSFAHQIDGLYKFINIIFENS